MQLSRERQSLSDALRVPGTPQGQRGRVHADEVVGVVGEEHAAGVAEGAEIFSENETLEIGGDLDHYIRKKAGDGLAGSEEKRYLRVSLLRLLKILKEEIPTSRRNFLKPTFLIG